MKSTSKIRMFIILVAATLTVVIASEPALALCNPGTRNCIKQGPNLGHFKNTVGNAGDCVGTTNDTCGLKTHPWFSGRTGNASNLRPTGSAGTRR